jgi:hypothetical protein
VVLVPAAGALGLWQAGFFLVPAAPSTGYGNFGMNLLAPLNPDLYSALLPPVAPPLLGFHEGYNFAGLGCLLLVPALLLAVARRRGGSWRGLRSHWPLGLVLLGLALFAVTHNVGVGRASFRLPLPDSVVQMASLLRSSGRMYWPVHYALLVFLIVAIARALPPRATLVLLALATAVQVFDSRHGWWSHLHAHFAASRATAWPSPLQSPFWSAAGREYRVLRRLPPRNSAPDYAAFAYFAASHQMASSAAYLARVDGAALDAAEQQGRQALQAGAFEPDTLYVLDPLHAGYAAEALDPDADLLARVDGYLVLAPGWLRRQHQGPPITLEPLALRDLQPGLPLDHELKFGTGGAGTAHLGEGWSQPEEWGVWSEGPSAQLTLPVDARVTGRLRLSLRLGAFVGAEGEQRVTCLLAGMPAAEWQFHAGNAPAWHELLVPEPALAAARRSQQLSIRFQIHAPASPQALGLNQDSRQLGVALYGLKLSLSQ